MGEREPGPEGAALLGSPRAKDAPHPPFGTNHIERFQIFLLPPLLTVALGQHNNSLSAFQVFPIPSHCGRHLRMVPLSDPITDGQAGMYGIHKNEAKNDLSRASDVIIFFSASE